MNTKISPYTFPGLKRTLMPAINRLRDMHQLTIHDVAATVCRINNVPIDILKTPARSCEASDTRHLIYYFATKRLHLTHKHIKEFMPVKQHHSTIIHGRQKVQAMIDTSPDWAALVATIAHELNHLDDQRCLSSTIKTHTA